jgi:asparagine N-glycosylation enzyme membrane subunit Stt3
MPIATAFEALTLTLLAVCVIVWPTQLIGDNRNRWLRVVAVAFCAVQIVVQGARVQLLPAYLVAAMFAGLLLIDQVKRQRQPGTEAGIAPRSLLGKVLRWLAVSGAMIALLVAAWSAIFQRVE